MGVLPTVVFCVSSAAAILLYCTIISFLYEKSEVKALSVAQYSVAIAYGLMIGLWAGCEAGFAAARMQPRYDSVAEDEQDLVSESGDERAEKSPAPVPPDAKIFAFKMSHLPILRLCAEFVGIMVTLCPAAANPMIAHMRVARANRCKKIIAIHFTSALVTSPPRRLATRCVALQGFIYLCDRTTMVAISPHDVTLKSLSKLRSQSSS